MQPQDRLNYENMVKKVHARLQKEVLKSLQIVKKKRIIHYVGFFVFIILITLIGLTTSVLKDISFFSIQYIIFSLYLMNIYYYIKCKRILSYEKDINNNTYYITKELSHYANIIQIEKLTNEEIQILLSLNTTDLEINSIISKIKEKNYITYKDLYDINNQEIINDVNRWGMVEDKELNQSLNIRKEIHMKDRSLLLQFENAHDYSGLEN